jgi:PAS domain S-box-containing protein
MQGLVDSATPIIIDEKHLGNAYIGQFLLEKPDIEYFRKQAQRYGFDEKTYLEALSKVSVLTSEELEQRLRVIRIFTEFVGEIGLERLKAIESSQRLSDIQHIAHLGSWGLDSATNRLTWSEETYRILGVERQGSPPTYEAFLNAVHPDDRTRVDAVHTQSVQQGISYNIEYRIVRLSDGESRYINEIGECAKDQSGKVVRALGMLHDITERKHSEEALRETQRKLSTLMSNLPGMAYRCRNDIDWTMEFVSEGVLELTGYQSSDLTLNKVSYGRKIIHPDDQERIWEEVQAALSEGRPFQFVYRITTATGAEKWVWEQGRGIFSPANELLALEGFITDITDQKHAEEELRFANIILRTQQETSLDGILVVDEEGKMISFNQRFVDMWNIPAEVVESKVEEQALQSVLSLLEHPEDFAAKVRFLYAHKNEKSFDEIPLIGDITFERYSTPMFGPDGEYYGRVWYFRDITDRKHAEEELNEAEAKYRSLVEDNLIGVYLIQNDRFAYANPRMADIFGYTQDELIGMSVLDTIAPEDRAIAAENIRKRISKEIPAIRYVLKGIRKDGRIIDVEVNGSRTIYNGKPAIIGSLDDITERKHTEEELNEAEAKYRSLVEDNLIGVYLVQDNKFVYANPRIADIFSYTQDELIGMSVLDTVAPEDRALVAENNRKRYSKEMLSIRYTFKGLRKDGRIIDVEVNGSSTIYNGKPAIIGSMDDITERKHTEESLKSSERRLADIINFLPDATFAINLEGKIIAWNRAVEEMTGTKAEDMMGKGDCEYAVPFYGDKRPMLIGLVLHPDKEAEERYQHFVREGNAVLAEAYTHLLDIYVWGKASPLYDPDGKMVGAIESVRNITERRRAEEERRQLEEHLEAQKRLFYRESLLSLTGEKLEICDPADIERYTSSALMKIALNTAADVPVARHEVRDFCIVNGLVGERLDLFLDGVGEAIANAIKHSIHGIVYGGSANDAVWVAVSDKGKGIGSLILPRATLGRGFSTKRSMGLGYTIILSVANHVLLNTGPNGTTVIMIMNLAEPATEMGIDKFPDTWV